jgi:predicted secreted protein
VGKAAGDTVIAASGATGRAIKAVADSEVAKKTAKRLKGAWRESVKGFREGMKGDDH